MSNPDRAHVAMSPLAFDELYSLLRYQAELAEAPPPTRGEVLDLVEGWRRAVSRRRRAREEAESRAMAVIARKKLAMQALLIGGANGHG